MSNESVEETVGQNRPLIGCLVPTEASCFYLEYSLSQKSEVQSCDGYYS